MLSGTRDGVANENEFHIVIDREFKHDFRLMDSDEKRHRRDELFEDIRGSATLTRSESSSGTGWQFSHNSLREYLVAESAANSLIELAPATLTIPITDAMRSFINALPTDLYDAALAGLKDYWRQRHSNAGAGAYLTILWDRMGTNAEEKLKILHDTLGDGAQTAVQVSGVKVRGIRWADASPQNRIRISGEKSEMADSSFEGLSLEGSSFVEGVLDSISFRGANLRGTDFSHSFLYDCDLRDADFVGANFRSLDSSSTAVVIRHDGTPISLSGNSLIGYLRYHRAETDAVDSYSIFQWHSRFGIVEKICSKLSEQRNRQLLGLTQKGESQTDPRIARQFVSHLQGLGWIDVNRNDLVSVTDAGRGPISALVANKRMDDSIVRFFEDHPM